MTLWSVSALVAPHVGRPCCATVWHGRHNLLKGEQERAAKAFQTPSSRG